MSNEGLLEPRKRDIIVAALKDGGWSEEKAEGLVTASEAEARSEALGLLREAAKGWEPGGGPFTVPLSTVNKIINLLAL